jgi:hypothetical protein
MNNSVQNKTKNYSNNLLAIANKPSSLTLLVARLTTDDANHTFALNDLAFAADLFNRGLNTHVRLLFHYYLAR